MVGLRGFVLQTFRGYSMDARPVLTLGGAACTLGGIRYTKAWRCQRAMPKKTTASPSRTAPEANRAKTDNRPGERRAEQVLAAAALPSPTRRRHKIVAARKPRSSPATPEGPTPPDDTDPAVRLLDEWLADESSYEAETWPELKEALDRDRLSNRRLFPD